MSVLRPDVPSWKPRDPPLPPDGGGGTSGGMEERVAKLDAQMEAANKRLDRIDTRLDRIDERLIKFGEGLATLTERVAHLPSKGFVVTATTGALALIGAMIAFQGKIQALLGLAVH